MPDQKQEKSFDVIPDPSKPGYSVPPEPAD